MASHLRPPIIFQFACFAAAGASGTAVHYVTLLCLVQIFLFQPVFASILGSIAGAVINYLLGHHWVFRSTRKHSETAVKFLAVSGVGMTLNAVIMHVLSTLVGIHYLLAQIASTGIVLVWNFLGNRLWTFADKKIPERSR